LPITWTARLWLPEPQAGRPRYEQDSAPITSRQDLLDDLARHVGQAEVAARVAVSQFLVIEAQKGQDRRLQIMDVDLLLDRSEAELVRRSVDVAALDAAAGQP